MKITKLLDNASSMSDAALLATLRLAQEIDKPELRDAKGDDVTRLMRDLGCTFDVITRYTNPRQHVTFWYDADKRMYSLTQCSHSPDGCVLERVELDSSSYDASRLLDTYRYLVRGMRLVTPSPLQTTSESHEHPF